MDKISGLPDELLVTILLQVPTKVAVSTSVLSKRWEYLWMWLPKLVYGHNHFSDSDEWYSLKCFLNKNLLLHRAPIIESFTLDLTSSPIKHDDIKLWIVIAVFHCVRELEIMYSCYQEKPNILPSNLYTCKSLVILKLHGEFLLDVPRMVSLPSLKTLELRSVIYFNEESLQRLLSNCSILEDLSMIFREKDATRELTVDVPSLLRLSLFIPRRYGLDGIVIVTPSLEYLELKDYSKKNHYYLVDNMPNLIEACVDVYSPNINSLIGSITSVKRLAICSEGMYDEGIVFNQLEHLEVCKCKEQPSNLLVRLLKDSPNLRELDLAVMKEHCPNYVIYWNQPSTVPECMLSSLQTLNWLLFGEPGEKDFVVYILQNAVHLKTARIIECKVPESKSIKKLALSSRASSTCQLIFD